MPEKGFKAYKGVVDLLTKREKMMESENSRWVRRAVARAANAPLSWRSCSPSAVPCFSPPTASVDWAMAEALAFGTLALHREVQPESLELPQSEDPTNEAIRGLNKGVLGWQVCA